MRQVALVLETTGVDESARIIEIAAIEMQDGLQTGNTFNVVINPHQEITAGADNVNHLSNLNVERSPDFASVVDKLLAFVKDADVVIQFSPFIKPIIDKELAAAGKSSLKDSCHCIIDTWYLDKNLNPTQKHNLDDMALRYGLIKEKRTDRVGARDARLLGEVYVCLANEAREKNIKIEPRKEVNLVIEKLFSPKREYQFREHPKQTERYKPY
jgi:DNA polymerase-3 subunit epsilon